MTIEHYDIELDTSASWTHTFTWLDPSTTLPINLTGFTAKMQIRWAYGDPAVQLELTSANGGIVLGGVNGTITLVITDIQTTALATGLIRTRGLYDLFLIDPSTSPHTVTKYTEGFVYADTPITILP